MKIRGIIIGDINVANQHLNFPYSNFTPGAEEHKNQPPKIITPLLM